MSKPIHESIIDSVKDTTDVAVYYALLNLATKTLLPKNREEIITAFVEQTAKIAGAPNAIEVRATLTKIFADQDAEKTAADAAKKIENADYSK